MKGQIKLFDFRLPHSSFFWTSVSKPLCFSPGFFAIVVSSLAVAAAVYQGVDLTYIHSHFLQLAVASFLISTLLSVYLYVHSLYAAPTELALGGSSGKGKELELPTHRSDPLCCASFTHSFILTVVCLKLAQLSYFFFSASFSRKCGLWLFQRTWAQSPYQRLWSEILLWDAPWSDWLGELSWVIKHKWDTITTQMVYTDTNVPVYTNQPQH